MVTDNMQNIYLAIPLAPLFGAIIAGLFGWKIGRTASHVVAIAGVAVAFVLSVLVFKHIVIDAADPFNGTVYTWMVSNDINFEISAKINNYDFKALAK